MDQMKIVEGIVVHWLGQSKVYMIYLALHLVLFLFLEQIPKHVAKGYLALFTITLVSAATTSWATLSALRAVVVSFLVNGTIHGLFNGKAHTMIFRANGQDLNLNLIPGVNSIFCALYAVIGQLRNVYQTLDSWGNLNKSPETGGADYLTIYDLAC